VCDLDRETLTIICLNEHQSIYMCLCVFKIFYIHLMSILKIICDISPDDNNNKNTVSTSDYFFGDLDGLKDLLVPSVSSSSDWSSLRLAAGSSTSILTTYWAMSSISHSMSLQILMRMDLEKNFQAMRMSPSLHDAHSSMLVQHNKVSGQMYSYVERTHNFKSLLQRRPALYNKWRKSYVFKLESGLITRLCALARASNLLVSSSSTSESTNEMGAWAAYGDMLGVAGLRWRLGVCGVSSIKSGNLPCVGRDNIPTG